MSLCELKKNTFSIAFILAVCLIIVLSFSSAGFFENEKAVTVFECLFMSKAEKLNIGYELCRERLMQNGFGASGSSLIPVICSFPFIMAFASERESTFLRYELYRSSKRCMFVSKFFCSMISGGLVVLAGTLIYCMIIYFSFPSVKECNLPTEMLFMAGYTNSFQILKNIIAKTVYGMLSVLIATAISSFVLNIYVVLCLPYMIVYMYELILDRLTLNYIFNGEMFERLYSFSSTAIINYITTGSYPLSLWLNLLLFTVCSAVFIIVMNRRYDFNG